MGSLKQKRPMKTTKFDTIEAIGAAVDAGEKIHWRSPAYTVFRSKLGELRIKCGSHVAVLTSDYKAEDFYSLDLSGTPAFTAGQTVRFKAEWMEAGEGEIAMICVDDEEHGRVTVMACLGWPVNPTQVVEASMLELAEVQVDA